MRYTGSLMYWTVKDNMVNGLFLCAALFIPYGRLLCFRRNLHLFSISRPYQSAYTAGHNQVFQVLGKTLNY